MLNFECSKDRYARQGVSLVRVFHSNALRSFDCGVPFVVRSVLPVIIMMMLMMMRLMIMVLSVEKSKLMQSRAKVDDVKV